MPSTFSKNLGIELIQSGEQAGAWGDTTNDNLVFIDEAIGGSVRVTLVSAGTSGAPNALTISDGAVSDGRNAWIEMYSASDLTSAVYVQLVSTGDTAERVIWIRNTLNAQDLVIFQGDYNAGRSYTVPNGKTALIRFDGLGTTTSNATNILDALIVDNFFPGIDDQATSVQLTITDTDITVDKDLNVLGGDLKIGNAGGGQIITDATDDQLVLAGDAFSSTGGVIQLMGSTNATSAHGIRFWSASGLRLEFVQASTLWDFKATDVLTTGDLKAEIIYAGNTALTVPDEFRLDTISGTQPAVVFDAGNDYLEYSRVNDLYAFRINNLPVLTLGTGESNFQSDGQISIGAPTGGFTGAGTINAKGYYVDGIKRVGVGIEDNATSTVLTIGDLNSVFDSYLTANKYVTTGQIGMSSDQDDDQVGIYGGTQSAKGAGLVLFGLDHPTLSLDIALQAAGVNELYYDHSASQWNFQANDIVTSGNLSTTQGVLSSVGIVDNVTSTYPVDNKRMVLADGNATWGDVSTFSASYFHYIANNGGVHALYGGPDATHVGMQLYGNSHPTTPGQIVFESGAANELTFILTDSEWDFQANDITTTQAVNAQEYWSRSAVDGFAAYYLGDTVNGFMAGLSYANGTSGEFIKLWSGVAGSHLRLHSDISATASDIGFYSDATTLQLEYDHSASTWDFQANDITTTGLIIQTPATGITAFAGGGQASATLLAEQHNVVSTIATDGDSVKLPSAVAGTRITVFNTSSPSKTLDVFPNTSDSIDGNGVNLAVQIQGAADGSSTYYAVDNTEWKIIAGNNLEYLDVHGIQVQGDNGLWCEDDISSIYLSGGDSAPGGGTIELFGGTHASKADQVEVTGNTGIGTIARNTSYDYIPQLSVAEAIGIGTWDGLSGGGAALNFTRSDSAVQGTHVAVSNNKVIGWIVATGSDGTNFAGESAAIGFRADGAATAADIPGKIEFRTTPSGSNFTVTRLVIGQDGTADFQANDIATTGDILPGGTSGPRWLTGSGTPEAVETAPIGSMFTRTDGGTGTTLYVKETGVGNTGWVAK